MDQLKKVLRPYWTPTNILIGIVVLGLLIIAIILLFQNFTSKPSEITQDQIRLMQGDKTVTINKNGLIEYKSKDETFYRIWDSGRVARFFTYIEDKARSYLDNPSASENCYQVSLYIDGNLVTVCIDDDEGLIEDALDEFDDESDVDIPLDDFFDDDDDDDGGGDGGSGTPTPTPTGTASGSTPTPTPFGGGGPPNNDPPVEATCETWEEDIVGGIAIISNTVCTKEE